MRCAPWVWRRLSVSLWMCVRACARSHLALRTCGNQLGDISPSRRRDANRVFTAAHSIRVKHELWARARPDGCGRCPCVLLFSISIGKTLRRCFFFGFIHRAPGCASKTRVGRWGVGFAHHSVCVCSRPHVLWGTFYDSGWIHVFVMVAAAAGNVSSTYTLYLVLNVQLAHKQMLCSWPTNKKRKAVFYRAEMTDLYRGGKYG